jgi:hypothetical protein
MKEEGIGLHVLGVSQGGHHPQLEPVLALFFVIVLWNSMIVNGWNGFIGYPNHHLHLFNSSNIQRYQGY